MPTPEEHARERLAARAAKYHAEVTRLRAAVVPLRAQAVKTEDRPEESKYELWAAPSDQPSEEQDR